jgi:cytochrome c oxidase subunit I+III
VFSFFYLWTVEPAGWPPPGMNLPLLGSSLIAAASWVVAAGAAWLANRALPAERGGLLFDGLMAASIAAAWLGIGFNLHALSSADLEPQVHGYTATLYTMLSWAGLHAVLLTLMAGYTLARRWAGLLSADRRNTFDNTRIMVYYSAAQAVVALAVSLAPRISG